jgi:hypothetical protein
MSKRRNVETSNHFAKVLLWQSNMTDPYDSELSEDLNGSNPYTSTQLAAPVVHQPMHNEMPSPSPSECIFVNATEQSHNSQSRHHRPSLSFYSRPQMSSRANSYPHRSSLEPPPCGQPHRRLYTPRTRYLSGSSGLGLGHSRSLSSESHSSHSREQSGSPNVSSTQRTNLDPEILWIRDEYTELRDSQLRIMDHILYLTQRIDKLSNDVFQSQKQLLNKRLGVGSVNIRWANSTMFKIM